MNEISIELHFTVKSFFCFLEIDEESAKWKMNLKRKVTDFHVNSWKPWKENKYMGVILPFSFTII